MFLKKRDLAGLIGTHVVPFTNKRVVCPPGRPAVHGRVNIVVATPRRCGTHLLIDIILNNMAAYRNRPLYIDLDKSWQQRMRGERLFECIDPNAGYVIKTHIPIGHPHAPDDPHLSQLLDSAVVLTVHRNVAAMVESAKRWWKRLENHRIDEIIQTDYEEFWSFWQDRPRISLEFEELFDANFMQAVLSDLSRKSGARLSSRYVPPPSPDRSKLIYTNKAMTRLVGRYAPRIDTTIHTLRKG